MKIPLLHKLIIFAAFVVLLAMIITAPAMSISGESYKQQIGDLRYQIEMMEHEFHELGYMKHISGHWYPDADFGMVCKKCGAAFAKAPYGCDPYKYCPVCGSKKVEVN